jgi:tetratricopeptide (TPR) repeat protein
MRSVRVSLVAFLLIFIANGVWGEKPKKPRFPAGTYKTTAKINLKDEYRMYDSAVTILEEALQFYEDDAELHFLLGKAYYLKKNYRGMGEQFAMAESLKSKKAKWIDELNFMRNEKWPQLFNQGVNAHNEQDYETALDRFLTCTILNPSDYRGFMRVGYAYALMEKDEEAISYMESGLKLEPDNPDLLRAHADVLFFAGKGEEALGSYDKVLESDPRNVEVLKNVASVYSRAGDLDQALSYLERAVEADSTYRDGIFNVGEIYRQRLNETIAGLDALKDDSGEYLKDDESAARIEELTRKKEEYLSSARIAYEKVMELDSADLEAQAHVADLYQEQEDFDRAMVVLESLVQKDSTNCKAWQQLAYIYAKKDVGEKANEAFQKAKDCFEGQKK